MRFAQTMADGSVTIHALADKRDIEQALGPLTDEQYLAHFFERNGLTEAELVALPDNWTPPDDRSFRNAWVMSGKAMSVDMSKARDIHRDRLRALRAPKLAALDADYLKADETGDSVSKVRIAAEKQALRDVTADPAIEAAKTPLELKSVLPAALRSAAIKPVTR